MYILGVKPWKSSKWQMPDLEEADEKTRERIQAARSATSGTAGQDENAEKQEEAV